MSLFKRKAPATTHHGGYSVSNNSDPNAGKRPGRPGFAN